MQRINTTDGKFHAGDPSTGALGTIVTSEFMQSVQDELVAVAVAGGVALDPTNNAQVVAAIRALAQEMRMQYGSQGVLAASTVLTTAIAGESIIWTGATGTLTLPDVSTMPNLLTATKVTNEGTGPLTLICEETQTFFGLGGNPASIVLQIGDDLEFNPQATTTWRVISGSALRQFNPLVIAPAVAAGQALQAGQALGLFLGSLQVLSSVSLTAAMATFTVGGRSVQATAARFRGQAAGGGGGGALPTGAGQASAGGGGNAGNPFEFVVSGITFPVSITVGAPGTGALGIAGTFGVAGGDLVVGSYATIKGGLGGPVGGLVGAFPAFNGLSGQGSNLASTFAAGVKVLNDGIGQVGNISTLLSVSSVSAGQGGAGPYGSVALGSGGESGYGVGGVASLNGASAGSGRQGGTAQPALLMIDFYS